VFARPGPRDSLTPTRDSSHGLGLSFRVLQASSGRSAARPMDVDPSGSSPEVSSPTAYPRTGQRHEWPGLPRPTACASRFSQPPGAFIRPEPAGLVSCRIRSWGCALQSFAPPTQPFTVSGALPLMTSGSNRRPSHPSGTTAETDEPAGQTEGPRERSRLQGFAPRESPPPDTGG
jgi:hypothetical protein